MKLGLVLGAVAAASVLVLSGCGNSDSTTDGPAAASPEPSMTDKADEMSEEKDDDKTDEKADTMSQESEKPATASADSVLPAVDVVDVANGENVDLAQLVPSKTPLLLWAWAPHCPICAGEAPAVQDFAEANGDKVEVVGLGTQDSLDQAEDFVATYGVETPQMLWDPGFESWQSLGITGQPTWVLVSAEGEELGRWQGGLPEDEILAAAG